MKLAIISGSHRAEAQSDRVSRVISARAGSLGIFEQIDILSLSQNPLPLWDESVYSGSEQWKQLLAPWRKTLKEASAIILVVPEWNGMVPAAVKNFFLLFSSVQLGHKPGLIVSVSAAQNGAYPVAELRMSSYKNCRICYLPEHLIVRNVAEAFTGKNPEDDQYLESRTDYCLRLLGEYAKGLTLVRESGVIDHKSFMNGM